MLSPCALLTKGGNAAEESSTHYTGGKRPRLLTVLTAVTPATKTVTVLLLLLKLKLTTKQPCYLTTNKYPYTLPLTPRIQPHSHPRTHYPHTHSHALSPQGLHGHITQCDIFRGTPKRGGGESWG